MQRAAPGSGPGRRIDLGLAGLAILAGAAIRLGPPWSNVFGGSGTVLLDTDAYYHLRRIQFAVHHFPAVPAFDPYVNFPEGARIIWPPGFDLLLATAARAFTAHPSAAWVERASAVAVPLLGLAAVLAVYAFARASLPWPGPGARSPCTRACCPGRHVPTEG